MAVSPSRRVKRAKPVKPERQPRKVVEDRQEDILGDLKSNTSLAHLGNEALRQLASSAVIRRYKKGEFILQEGDQASFFQLIQAGRVKLFKQTPSGKDFILGVLSRGQALNAAALVEGSSHFVSAQALDAVTVLRVPRKDYLLVLERNPLVALKIIGALNDLLSSTYDRLIDLLGERVEQRVCNVLYMLHAKFGENLRFTNEEIANLGGMASETAIRVMTKLKEKKLVAGSGRGQLRIVDAAGLERLSRGPFFI